MKHPLISIPVLAGILLPAIIFFAAPPSLLAQPSSADSNLYKTAVANMIARYHVETRDQSGLLNGSQYPGYLFSFKDGHPFFISDSITKGDIVYDNIQYEGVSLQYDEVQEVIVMQDGNHRIQLLNQRITAFRIFNQLFVKIIKDTTASELVKSGFYNLLYNGPTRLLKKEIKTVREEINNLAIIRYIDPHIYYYLKKGNVYYVIPSKRKFFRLMDDHKKEVQQYVRQNKLSYKNNRDEMLTKATAYYNQLSR